MLQLTKNAKTFLVLTVAAITVLASASIIALMKNPCIAWRCNHTVCQKHLSYILDPRKWKTQPEFSCNDNPPKIDPAKISKNPPPKQPQTKLRVPTVEATFDYEFFINLICPKKDLSLNKGDKLFACQKCPAFTTYGGIRKADLFAVSTGLSGSFSSPGSNEALLFFRGCEFKGIDGGAVLFARNGNQWRFTRYFKGLFAHDCLKLRLHAKKDALLCQQSSDVLRRISDNSISILEISENTHHKTVLLSMLDSHGWCGYLKRLFVGKVNSWILLANEQGEAKKVSLDVTVGVLENTNATNECADDLEDKLTKDGSVRHQFDVIYNGSNFVLSKEGEQLSADLKKLYSITKGD